MPKHKSTLMDRFLAKVQKTETCWWWKPSKETKNYGKFWNETRQEDAHRVAYRMFVGGIPKNMCVLHKCDINIV
jgi:hypothetical protein